MTKARFLEMDNIKSISIDNEYGYLLCDKVVKSNFKNEIVFLSIIGYNNTISSISKIINNTKDTHNIRISGMLNSNFIKNKYKIIVKKKDNDFTHLIALAQDTYKFDERSGEFFSCYVYCKDDSKEEKEKKVYEKLLKYSSIPILKEWMPYIIEQLEDFYYSLQELDRIGIIDDIIIYSLQADRNVISSIVTRGLHDKKININGDNKPSILLDECSNLNEYLNMFGESYAKKIQYNFKPKFTPGQDKYDTHTNVIDDYIHYKANIEMYEAQKTVVQACVNNWKTSRNTMICGEMGSGKSLMSMSAIYVDHNCRNNYKGFNALIMCPSHLTKNWEREVNTYIPNSKAYTVKSIKDLINLTPLLTDKYRRNNIFIILSKETAKLDYLKRPSAIWKEYHSVPAINNKYVKGGGVFVCPECGKILKKTVKVKEPDPRKKNKLKTVEVEVPLDVIDFANFNNKHAQYCSNKIKTYNHQNNTIEYKTCNCPLWQPIAPSKKDAEWIEVGEKGWIMKNHIDMAIDYLENLEELKGYKKLLDTLIQYRNDEDKLEKKTCNKFSYKCAISKYIKNQMKGVFDYLIADEVHELNKEDTLQGISFHQLVKSVKKTICLTGTIIDGHANSIFYTLYRLYPSQMKKEGFYYNDENAFQNLYGVSIKRNEIQIDKYGKEKVKSKSPSKAPGVSPLVFTKFLLNNTVFVSLDDMTEGLPPYKETPIPVEMDDDLKQAYEDLKNSFQENISSCEPRDKASVMKQYSASLVEYIDTPYYQRDIINKNKDEIVYCPNVLEKKYRNKELALLNLVKKKVEANEKVLIYYESINTTDLSEFLLALFKRNNIKAHILRSKDSTSENRIKYIEDILDKGIDVLITNPSLVKTGLNLIDFTTIVFYQLGYNLETMRQASRRSWRLSQKNPVNVYFMYYENTAQETCLSLMANKLLAAQSIEGKFSSEGLKALSHAQNVLTQIANNVVNNIKDTVDPNLFKASTFVKKNSNKIKTHNIPLDSIELDISDTGRSKTFEEYYIESNNYVIESEYLYNPIALIQ